MSTTIDARILRVRHSLGVMRSEDLSGIRVFSAETDHSHSVFVDFNQGRTATDLEHLAFALIASIASLKDHLKEWCVTNGRPFTGEELIDSNRDVAIVHDLWNIDKHARLTRPPRSGAYPALRELRQNLLLSTGTEADSGVGLFLNPKTRRLEVRASGGGGATVVINAQVVDEHGMMLGWLQAICESAISAWEAELEKSGVPLSK